MIIVGIICIRRVLFCKASNEQLRDQLIILTPIHMLLMAYSNKLQFFMT